MKQYKLALCVLCALFCGAAAQAQGTRITASEYIDNTPKTTVQTVGDQVQVVFDVNVPANYMGRNEAYVITPELRNGNWSQTLPALAIEGSHYNRITDAKFFFKERKYRDSTVYLERVPYKGKEMTVHYQTVIPRTAQTDGAKLVLNEDHRCDCYTKAEKAPKAEKVKAAKTPKEKKVKAPKAPKDSQPVEVAVVPVTEPAPVVEPTPASAPQVEPTPAPKQPARVEKQYTDNFGHKSVFQQGSSDIDQEAFNAGYEKMCKAINTVVKNDNGVIEHVSIRTASSPEGPVAKNLELAKQRGEALRESIAAGLHISPSIISVDAVAENWDGFMEFLNTCKWKNKQQILDIIAKYDDLDAREAALRRMPNNFYYNRIQQEFQNLRNCDVVVDYTVDAPAK